MNTLVLKSCKHQGNTITFTRENNTILVEGGGQDSWTQDNATIVKSSLESVDIKIQRGKGDNDITVTLATIQNSISAVIGSPGNSGDTYNSGETYLLFNEIIIGGFSLHDYLMSILD